MSENKEVRIITPDEYDEISEALGEAIQTYTQSCQETDGPVDIEQVVMVIMGYFLTHENFHIMTFK